MSFTPGRKKRGPSYQDDNASMMSSPETQFRKKRTPLNKKKQQGLSEFAQRVHKLKNAAFEQLNKEFQTWTMQQNLSENTPLNTEPEHPEYSVVPQAVEAYLASSFMINQRFGTERGTMVIAWGNNDCSQLGWVQPDDGETTYLPSIAESLRGQNIKQVKCGGTHGVALSTDGIPWTWGANDDFGLGREDQKDASAKPVRGFYSFDGKNEDGTILKVAAGLSFTLFLTIEGNVYTTGMYKETDSQKYKIPSTDTEPFVGQHNKTPQQIAFSSKVKDIFAGENFAAAILDDGNDTLVTWGMGLVGEMARSGDIPGAWDDKKGAYNIKPEFYKREGKPDEALLREHFLKPKPVRFNWGSDKKSIVHVACGQSHLLVVAREPGALSTNVYASGHNGYYQCNPKECYEIHELTLVKKLEGENILQVAGGRHFSMALSMDRKRLFAWGRGDRGQLGTGRNENKYTLMEPTLVPFPTKEEGDEPILIQEIICGEEHAMAISAENDLYTWGFEGTTGHKGMEESDVKRPSLLDLSISLKRRAKCFGAAGGANGSLAIVKVYGPLLSGQPAPEKIDENTMAS